jgi:hypothetical protein
LEELYTNEFASFIKKKIVDRARIRLGMFPSQEERGDLGDVFCLTDPHQEVSRFLSAPSISFLLA